MRITTQFVRSAIYASVVALLAMGLAAAGQARPEPVLDPMPAAAAATASQPGFPAPQGSYAVEQLRSFTEADVKFDLRDLMELLRDRRHEGWVLAAYPDPKTGHPLIGAGFSLDLPAREHPQRDPLNPHPFIEPSSVELWQAAGLDSGRLQTILNQYDDRLAAQGTKRFRKRLKTLTPQISDEEATRLLRVSAIQAIYNAKGYCRHFDQWTASQQMALAQLVYQMGINLQEFSQFLGLMNSDFARSDGDAAPQLRNDPARDGEYWTTVQQSLIQSQWARLYRARAVSVIAMLDPQYGDEPGSAIRRLSPLLPPEVVRRHKGRSAATRQLVSATSKRGAGSASRRAKSHPQRKRKT
jgi:hypothetical protein